VKEYPMAFNQFTLQFASEGQCRNYLYALRSPNGFVCPECSHNKPWLRGDNLYECEKCKHGTSVTAGTVFQDTRKPLKDWFVAIWRIATQKYGVSAEGFRHVLGLKSYETAWAWLHKIRTAMVVSNRSKLSGGVEVGEAYIGGESAGKRGRGTETRCWLLWPLN
jgi:transposase-like protein